MMASIGYPAALVVVVVVLAAVPALFHHRYYFSGDTQAGAVGQWYHLGQALRNGQWPLLDLPSWRAGNFAAEGQWGLFSPLTMLIALATTVVPNFVVFVTLLKTALLVLGALGMYLLVRSYAAPPPVAFLAGAAITLGGASQYLESPSWVTGQMVWALLPWAWWSLRRLLDVRAHPAPALVSGFLLVTVGYVYGTLFLALVVLVCLVDAALSRNWRGLLRVLVAGVLCGLVAVTVYLPGVLTASVTTRSSWQILSAGRLQADMPGLAASMLPIDLSPNAGFGPIHYIAWFLPMVLWVDPARARALLRPMTGAWLMLGFMLAWALGPNQVGPIRWPMRVMPEVTITAVLVASVLIAGALQRRPSRGRLMVSIGWVVASTYLVVARFWTLAPRVLASGLLVVAALVWMWWLLRRRPFGLVAAASGALVLVATVVLQHSYYPLPASADRNMSALPSDYRKVAATARGDVMLLGRPERLLIANARATTEQLVASSWYLTDHPVQSVYSTIGFQAFNERYCIAYNGTTCPRALSVLLSREPTTGERRVDLLSVSTLHFNRRDFPDKRLLNPPRGWRATHESRFAVTWVRTDPLPGAGGVVWHSDGMTVDDSSGDVRMLRVHVGEVPATGGRLVLSRLAWPGYTVDGARLASPTDGYLLSLDVPPSAAGHEVVLRFSPPGWAGEMAALWIAIVVGVLWSLLAVLTRLGLLAGRRRPGAPDRGTASG